MKNTIALAFALLSSWASAQNWALLNPAYKYNYSNDGTDTISNQIRVTDIDTLGVDSFRYELNRVGVVCDTCSSLPAGCGDHAMLGDQPQYLNTKYLVHGSNTWILGPDSLVIFPNAGIGTSWEIGLGLNATVTAATLSTVLSVVDSFKTISVSNGAELILSKDHGLVSVPSDLLAFTTDLALIGIEGLSIGEHFPTVDDLLNYQPGDILQYELTRNGQCDFPLYHCHAIEKLTVIQRSDTSDHPTYALRRVSVEQCWGPCFPVFSAGIDTIVLDTHGCQVDLLALALRELWPGSIALSGTWCNEGFSWNVYWVTRLNSDHRYVLQTADFEDESKILRLCQADIPAYDIGYYDPGVGYDAVQYEEGIGLKYYSTFIFEGGNTRVLTGWSIDGQQTGEIASDDSILSGIALGLMVDRKDPSLTIAPNPASDHLSISSGSSTPFAWRVCSMSGVQVLSAQAGSDDLEIDVSTLPAGPYLFEAVTSTGVMRKRVIIAH